MNSLTPSDAIQILILIALFGTGILIALQLRATNKSIRLSTIIPRMQAFNAITDAITEEDIKTFIIHKSENFTDAIYNEHWPESYKGTNFSVWLIFYGYCFRMNNE